MCTCSRWLSITYLADFILKPIYKQSKRLIENLSIFRFKTMRNEITTVLKEDISKEPHLNEEAC